MVPRFLIDVPFSYDDFGDITKEYFASMVANTTSIKLNFQINAPVYVWGIRARRIIQSGGSDQGKLDNSFQYSADSPPQAYFGLQSKFGVDGGKLFDSPTVTIHETATDPKLQNIKGSGDTTITDLENKEFEGFKSRKCRPNSTLSST